MIRQYYPQRRRGGDNPLGVGVIPTSAIFYLQCERWWRERFRGMPICRDPWIVESFSNGVLCEARRDPSTGRWLDLYVSGRSDMATVRSLRDGRRREVAVRILVLHEDEGLRRDPATYPSLPHVRNERAGGEQVSQRAKPRVRLVAAACSADTSQLQLAAL